MRSPLSGKFFYHSNFRDIIHPALPGTEPAFISDFAGSAYEADSMLPVCVLPFLSTSFFIFPVGHSSLLIVQPDTEPGKHVKAFRTLKDLVTPPSSFFSIPASLESSYAHPP